MSKTVSEMFREVYGHRPDRLSPTGYDKVLFKVRTFHLRCPACGHDTVPLDPQDLHGIRVCVQCLLNEVVEHEEYEELDEEELSTIDTLRNQLEYSRRAVDSVNMRLKAESDRNSMLTSEIQDLSKTLTSKLDLIAEMSEECEALRKRVDAFDDDSAAIKNENARLKLDLQKMKDVMAQRRRIGS